MRDAVTLEARGIPTIILVNDVFEPIARATAALLALGPDYVEKNVVWLPHPTSNLTPEAAAALIDERKPAIVAAFLGRRAAHAESTSAAESEDPLQAARDIVAGLAQSLRADGADLLLTSFEHGVLTGELRIGDVTCEDGACIMPAAALAQMVRAMVRAKMASLREVTLHEIRLP